MKIVRLQFILAAVFTTFAFMLSSTPKPANAQHWTLSGIHIYNNNTGYVGIGMTAPQATIHMGDGNAVSPLLGLLTANFVLSQEGATTGMQGIVASSGAAGHRMNFEGIRARGTLAAPTVPVLDDRVFTLTGKIFDGGGVQNTAQVTFFVDGTVNRGVAPQRISFRTGPTDTASKTENLVIASTGEVFIPNVAAIGGTFAPGGLLGLADANTYLNVDGGGNMTFTDAVTGTKTLADLAAGGAETDPVFTASPAAGITGTQITNWDTAFGWGNHATAGYLTAEVDGSTTNELQNLFSRIIGDTGSTIADIQADTLTIVGSGGISTSVTGDTLTISGSGGGGVTLDGAYDFGGAGAGRTITADAGAVEVAGIDGVLATGTFGSGTIPATGTGTRMMWYPKKAAFRVGFANTTEWDDVNIGDVSIAMGLNTVCSGNYSTAMGNNTTASGNFSTAMGSNTTASGANSTAMGIGTTASNSGSTAIGSSTTASGSNSTAMGGNTTASGVYSTAMGNNTTANGSYSTVMGYNASANGMTGSFVYGDASSVSILNATAPHQFSVRASGGYRFFTTNAMTIGAQLASGANSWTTMSDVNLKENFKPINGEDMLDKIAGFEPATWNYKSQEPGKYRHYGPMAQDFYAAFGNDGIGTIGNDTTIATADLMGVNFTAINALEKRTREQAEQQAAEMEALRAENTAIKEHNLFLEARLADIEELLNKKK